MLFLDYLSHREGQAPSIKLLPASSPFFSSLFSIC
jgi:hypothetical protein